MDHGSVLVFGGTGGIRREVARHYHQQGHEVTITGRDLERATTIAAEIGADVGALAFNLAEPGHDRRGPRRAGYGITAHLVGDCSDRSGSRHGRAGR